MCSRHILKSVLSQGSLGILCSKNSSLLYPTIPTFKLLNSNRQQLLLNSNWNNLFNVRNLASNNNKANGHQNSPTTSSEADLTEAKVKEDQELRAFLDDINKDFDENLPADPSNPDQDGGKTPPKHQLPKNDDVNDFSSGPVINSSSSATVPKKFLSFEEVVPEEILEDGEELPLETTQNAEQDEETNTQDFYLYQQKSHKFQNVNLQRGKEGVIDLHELISFLKEEKMRNIVVIAIPAHCNYCQYLVITSALSARHLKATTELLKKFHKLKKSAKDRFISIEGENCTDWKVLDMNNLVVHMFLKPARRRYDLETLWSVGPDYDQLSRTIEDPLQDLLQKHIQYLDTVQATQ